MANFIFETITPAEAAAFQTADSLAFQTGSASLARVAFPAADQIAVSMAGRTVTFGAGMFGETATFPDGGVLYIGTPAADAFSAGAGVNALFGGPGLDVMNGGAAADLMQGNQDGDTLNGGAGGDTLQGGQGDDMLTLGSGADVPNLANGNLGNDTVIAGDGGDTVQGGQGLDLLFGGAGADLIHGNLGDDKIDAGAGADTIHGDGGYDIMWSGAGADLFMFEPGSSVIDVINSDRIMDWTPEDRISLPVHGGYAEVEATPPAPPMDPYGGGGGYAPVGDFEAAHSAANMALASNPALTTVAAQGGSDVDVFIDSNGDHVADMAIILSNTTLASVSEGNFV